MVPVGNTHELPLLLIPPLLIFFNLPATTEIYTLSLHDALPISLRNPLYHWTHLELVRYFGIDQLLDESTAAWIWSIRSEEHTSELQSHSDLVCRLLLEKKKESETDTVDDNGDLNKHTLKQLEDE